MDEATTGVRFLLGGAMLLGAVVYDLRERRVPNPWWVPFAWMAALLAAGDLLDARGDWGLLAIRYGMAGALAGLAYLMWRLRLFGGADAKALMVLAALAPWPPARGQALQPALDALANGALAMALVPAVFLVANVARGHLAFPAALLGTPRPLEAARRSHVWPMQVADPATPRGLRWRYWQRIGGGLEAEYEALERAGVQRVWVTPKVPFLVPLACGWAVAWTHGNLLLAALRWLA